jgi:trimeric autotransporter adhesin
VQSLHRSALLLGLIAILVAAPAAGAAPRSTPVPFPNVNGSVQSLLVAGRTAYVGGHFTAIGNPTGPLAFLDPRSGKVRRGFPAISGDGDDEAHENRAGVLAVEPDGRGGLYVAGHFSRVAGQRRVSLVHLRADGSVDPRFRADADNRVYALALAGGRLWIGGSFSHLAGRWRPGFAVVDARTGALTPIGGETPPGFVWSLEQVGRRMYAGGFTAGLIAYDVSSGERLPWAPEVAIPGPEAMESRGGKLYVTAGSVLELDAADGRILRRFDLDAGQAKDLALAGHTLLTGGPSHTDTKRGLFAYDLRTGERLSKFADVEADVGEIAVHRGTVYANRIWKAGGKDRGGGLVAFDLARGRVRWTIRENTIINDMRVHRGRLVVAGQMRVLGAARRQNLAAIDLPTGRVKRFDPRVTGPTQNFFSEPYVSALAKRGRALYLGGSFTGVRGGRHVSLAAVDARTGRPRDRVPSAGGTVNALATAGSTLYVGGELSALGDVPRSNLGAVDLRRGRVTGWAPEPIDEVHALAVSGGVLHVGGEFSRIAGRTDVNGLAAFDLPTGGWSSRFRSGPVGGYVHALAADGDRGIWVGGVLGGFPEPGERGLAHLDAGGRLVGRVPVVDGEVGALAARDGLLYLGGPFERVAGRLRAGAAAIRTRDGAVTGFEPRPSGRTVSAWAPLPHGGVLAGGFFSGTEYRATSGLARFRP